MLNVGRTSSHELIEDDVVVPLMFWEPETNVVCPYNVSLNAKTNIKIINAKLYFFILLNRQIFNFAKVSI